MKTKILTVPVAKFNLQVLRDKLIINLNHPSLPIVSLTTNLFDPTNMNEWQFTSSDEKALKDKKIIDAIYKEITLIVSKLVYHMTDKNDLNFIDIIQYIPEKKILSVVFIDGPKSIISIEPRQFESVFNGKPFYCDEYDKIISLIKQAS